MIQYKIDNVAIEDYGIHVSKANGIIGRPQPKERRSVSYGDCDGKYVDLGKVRYNERNIELECFLVRSDRISMIEDYNRFCEMLNKPGTRRLSVSMNGVSGELPFEVYNTGDLTAVPEWDDKAGVFTFTLALQEAKPIKRVYLVRPMTSATGLVEVEIVSEGTYDIHWGDGTHELDLVSDSVKHLYEEPYADMAVLVISGDIDAIRSVEIRCEHKLVYSKI